MTSGFDLHSTPALSVSKQTFEEVTQLAAAICAIADALGIEDQSVERVRDRAVQRSRADQIEDMQLSLAADRRKALQSSKRAFGNPTPAGDGSRVHGPGELDMDEQNHQAALAAQRYPQLAAHREMAKGKVNELDAHAATRASREAIYQKMAEEAERDA